MRRNGGVSTLALAGLLTLSGLTSAQTTGFDAVERLRHALRMPEGQLAERQRIVEVDIAALRTPSELRRAILLPDWHDNAADGSLVAVDLANRAAVIERFNRVVRELVRQGQAGQSAAVIDQVCQLAREARQRNQPALVPRQFTPDLVRLVQNGDPALRTAAILALGQVEPPLSVALPTLGKLWTAKEDAIRRACAEALEALLQTALLPLANDRAAQEPSVRCGVAGDVAGVVRIIGTGLGDAHPEVRRRCAMSVGEAAALLARLAADPAARPDGAPAGDLADLRELGLAICDQIPQLAHVLQGDRAVRFAAQKALEEVAVARASCLKVNAGSDPFLPGLRDAVPAVSERLADPDVRLRRSALDVLEWLGPAAAEAAPAVTRALSDPDRFVRWSAIRVLGNLGGAALRAAAADLARLQGDPDVDIRQAAAAVLERVNTAELVSEPKPTSRAASGPQGPSAVKTNLPNLPANLLRSLQSPGAATRLEALRTLRALGADARPAIPALRELLADPVAKVRLSAAEVLGQLGPLARDAVNDLRASVADPDANVRHAAGEALLSIMR